ncbi:epimerase [Cohnella thailandensis]|uniref:DUF1731 domain-containing protein n=1 Tax=Cohnella thailandensis TaxID=557557 RepID=A0A841SXT5_9BACL|nr:DUF1731 domain-containing protein [Cohnella thailandensis]MBB6633551.1 DUF1731 domain-containing protein [Cohnella thailandensis]MBP1974568.1 NAD dependent epimerase/dehydratase family enzyme [Cohnella thailandensis]
MRLMLCGGTGFIGNALAQALLERGDEVWIVTRRLPATPVAGLLYVTWEEWSQQPWQWNGIDAIVNLVGESVGKKWTEERKRQILVSRTLTALRIEDIVRRMDQPPKVLVNASGISLYGHSYSPLMKRKSISVRSKLSAKRSLFTLKKEREAEDDPLPESSIPSAPEPKFEPMTAERAGIRGFSSRTSETDEEKNAAEQAWAGEPVYSARPRHEEIPSQPESPPSYESQENDEFLPESRKSSSASEYETDADLMELLAKLRSSEPDTDENRAEDLDVDFPLLREERRESQTVELFDEDSPALPEDYLGQVVVAWEEAVDRIPIERIVKVRISLVLGRDGGTFPLLRLPYRMFAGGRIGSGMQGFPWIHIDDMVGLILFCLDDSRISGPINAVAPDPVNNDEFGRTLAYVSRRPYWFHAPASLVEKALGEQSVLLLTGQHAYPRKALEHGYVFSYPRLEDALRNLLNR